MLTKIISGGQTGADRAGLIAAKNMGIATGGWMPKGYRAHDGNHPEFSTTYNITEDTSPSYAPRTFKNVYGSDGTVRFAVNFDSAGEQCTLIAISKSQKPYFDVNIVGTTQPADLVKWIIDNNINILNVAGNSEKTAKGIEEFVVAFLTEVINQLQHT